MVALLFFAFAILAAPFKSNRRLTAENAALRQQLIVLRRQMRGLCVPRTSSALISRKNRLISAHDDCAAVFLLAVLAAPIKSKGRLEAENAALRHQLIVLRRKMQGRARLTNSDRWFFIQLYRWLPSILNVVMIVRPETLVRWHRAGFRGNRAHQEGAPRLIRTCVRSSGG